MGKRELVTRRRDESDRRSVLIQRTQKGQRTVERIADALAAAAKDMPA
jgi:DNA-binding MarR family transcriptional regulator